MTFRQYRRAVGERIRKARWIAGWTQAETAHKARITFRYYCDIERGHASPKVETLFHLAHVLGRRASEFLDVEDAPSGFVSLGEAVAEAPKTGRPAKPRRRRS